VRTENLDSPILMMEPPENRSRCDASAVFSGSSERRIHAQRSMRPQLVVVGGKLGKGPPQVGLPKHDHVVEAFLSDCAD
jgi:hypothetical protein